MSEPTSLDFNDLERRMQAEREWLRRPKPVVDQLDFGNEQGLDPDRAGAVDRLLIQLGRDVLDRLPEDVLRETVGAELRRVGQIEDPDFRVKALKTDFWSFRWTTTSLRMFQAAAFPRLPFYDIVFAILSAASAVYIWANIDELAQRITLLTPLSVSDQVFGWTVVVLAFEATRRTVGLGLTAIVAVFLLYNLFGHHFEGVMNHGYISPSSLLMAPARAFCSRLVINSSRKFFGSG